VLIGCALGALLASLIASLGVRHNQSVSNPITLYSARLAMATENNSFSAQLAKTQFMGWNAYRLTNGLVTLYVT
jgi:hypothetical protein